MRLHLTEERSPGHLFLVGHHQLFAQEVISTRWNINTYHIYLPNKTALISRCIGRPLQVYQDKLDSRREASEANMKTS